MFIEGTFCTFWVCFGDAVGHHRLRYVFLCEDFRYASLKAKLASQIEGFFTFFLIFTKNYPDFMTSADDARAHIAPLPPPV